VWAIKNGVALKDAYAHGNKEYEENEKAKEEILEINKKIYDERDEEINKILEESRKESLEQFESIYKRLDSKFDYHFYESESGEVGKELVEENIGKVFEKGEKGAVIFQGENFEPKTHTRVFLNSEGLPTYEAKELGLAQIKKDWLNYDKSITVTGNEQDSFFQVVEVAIGEVFPELKGKLMHLSHGMLKLPSGKMSSRTGSVIRADDLIEQVKDKVLEKIKDREFNDKEKDSISEIIAIGAIKYSILRQAIGGDIVFDFDKSVSFEGDSGPYLQYATVRASSILEKSKGVVEISEEIPVDWQTTNLERLLERFGSIVEKSGREYSPHYLVTYLTELASEFNRFYAEHKIIDENDQTSGYRLAITEAFVNVMTKGLHLLAIKVPEKM
ncbi:MAG TPA: arginine--tRNA ligase, partial [Candidatus Paceibacterota bacterium]